MVLNLELVEPFVQPVVDQRAEQLVQSWQRAKWTVVCRCCWVSFLVNHLDPRLFPGAAIHLGQLIVLSLARINFFVSLSLSRPLLCLFETYTRSRSR